MTFFNKLIDKARASSQPLQAQDQPIQEQQPSPSLSNDPASLHNTFTAFLHNHHQVKQEPSGLVTPPASAAATPYVNLESRSTDESRMSVDSPEYAQAVANQEDRSQQQQVAKEPSMHHASQISYHGAPILNNTSQAQPSSLPQHHQFYVPKNGHTAAETYSHSQSMGHSQNNANFSTMNHHQQQQQPSVKAAEQPIQGHQLSMQPPMPRATPMLQSPPPPRRPEDRQTRSAPRPHPRVDEQTVMQMRANRPKLKLADFKLLRTLGTGSFGRVHLIQSRVNARFYAMKVLKKSQVVKMKQVEHTNNEKHILESTSHPFIVNMWGTFQDDINLYMIMDYAPGGELFSILRKMQRFPDQMAKFYAAEVLLAIEYLHSKDTIYRDLKPENLLLDAFGHIKITDFGFAKYVPDITWTLCGTPDYLAPEIIQSKGYGKAVDWWSFGVLIFEMLAGYPPFYDDDHVKLYEKILAGKIRWPQYFDPNAKDLLKRLLTPDLSKRFGNLKGGSEDIKRHRWFEGVDFNYILSRQQRAPHIPQLEGLGDARHFELYQETQEQYGVTGLSDPYRHLFIDF